MSTVFDQVEVRSRRGCRGDAVLVGARAVGALVECVMREERSRPGRQARPGEGHWGRPWRRVVCVRLRVGVETPSVLGHARFRAAGGDLVVPLCTSHGLRPPHDRRRPPHSGPSRRSGAALLHDISDGRVPRSLWRARSLMLRRKRGRKRRSPSSGRTFATRRRAAPAARRHRWRRAGPGPIGTACRRGGA